MDEELKREAEEKQRMDNLVIVNKVLTWQNAGYFHPLTCGNEECRCDLLPEIKGSEVRLCCPECDYTQDVPEFLLDFDIDTYVRYIQNLLKDIK